MKALSIHQPWGFALERRITDLPCFDEPHRDGIVDAVELADSLSEFEVCND